MLPVLAPQEHHGRACQGGIADGPGAALQGGGIETDTGGAVEVQEAAEAPGDDETGGAFGAQAPGLQQGEHSGADSALGQLQHTDVLLGQGHLRRQEMGILLVGEGAGFVDDPRPEENRRRIDETAAADACGGGAFYGVTEDFVVFIGHPVDGAGAGLHTPGDGGTLKDGPGGGGAAQQTALMPQG